MGVHEVLTYFTWEIFLANMEKQILSEIYKNRILRIFSLFLIPK